MNEAEKLLMDAEFILVIIEGKIKVLKNRNLIKRSVLVNKLEEL